MIGGTATMPDNFRYKSTFLRGKPVHREYDSFWLRHPFMSPGHFAKIFAPFDALSGFDDMIASKEILYENRRELDDDALEELNRKLRILHTLTFNGKLARENQVRVSVTFYVPCKDSNNFSYQHRGRYLTVAGICRRVGLNTLEIDGEVIPLRDITVIEGDCFDEDYAYIRGF